MSAADSRTWQVHANVSSDHGDSALRLTVTFYDETGHSYAHKTWRKHVRALWYEDAEWTAYSAAVDLARMMGEACGSPDPLPVEAPDSPLPGL